jgi:uncharacterized protein YdaL
MRQAPQALGLRNVSWSTLSPRQLAENRKAVRTTGWFGYGVKSLEENSGCAPDVARAIDDVAGASPSREAMASTTRLPVLVLYDSVGYAGFVSNLYARMLSNVLSNSKSTVYVMPVEQYTAGTMNTFGQTFYMGGVYDNPLPDAFKADALATTKPLCWMGYNLWQIAWTPDWTASNPAFTSKFGFTFSYIDGTPMPYVTYKNETLDNDPLSNGMGRISILDAVKAKAIATAKTADGTNSMPYIVKGANLYYVADNPLQDSSAWMRADRSLAFEDLINDIIGYAAPTTKSALLRIEDVHPESDPTMLRNIADVLAAEAVPYVICVIPRFEDPYGAWNDGVPLSTAMKDSPAVVSALKYMTSKGGQIIMHGYTHQYGALLNPWNGTSGDDYEFYRVEFDANGNAVPTGPVPADSATWVRDRITAGFNALSAAKLGTPKGWNTPHYLASPTDYQEFKGRFTYSMCRGKVFGIDPQGRLAWVEQEAPYPINDDIGARRLPETLGYVSTPELGVTGALPADLVAQAHKLKVVRNAYASAFFHWFLPPSMLQELVRGIKSEGYTFKAASATLN